MEDLVYWVWLSLVFPYGSIKQRELLSFFDNAKSVFESTTSERIKTGVLNKAQLSALKQISLKTAEEIIAECEEKHIDITAYNDEKYPLRLKNIINPPMVIYSVGDISGIDDEVCLAVVGTRQASDYGKKLTGNLCYELAKAGVVIVSGCAVGIDTYAHLGAVKAGRKTIGVLACGIDVDYPAKSRDLKKAMLKYGALISEMPPGEKASKHVFGPRNRLMSALCNGVMVTEAPEKSGALITAEHALEQGRNLFCVPPHDIYDQNFAGVSKYIRDGAIPVCSAKDILIEYINAYPHKINYHMVFSDVIKTNIKSKVDFDIKTSREVIASKKNNFNKTKTSTQTDKNSYNEKHDKKDDNIKTTVQKNTKTEIENTVVKNETFAENKTILSEYGEDYVKVYEALDNQKKTADDIIASTGLPVYKVLSILTELELMNIVKAHAGSRYSKG